MRNANKILLGVGFAVLLLIAWAVAANAKSPTQKQLELIAQANEQISYKCFAVAMPLLEEAVGYNGKNTIEAETQLKLVYLELMGQSGIRNKYLALLDRQMNRADAEAYMFEESARFYLAINKTPDALNALKSGIAKLNNQSLIDFYEGERYAFEQNHTTYEDVTTAVNNRIQVRNGEFWGIANSDGSLVIPCEYEQISNYGNARVIVKKGNEIFAVDIHNNRIALLSESATDIANYGNDRVPIKTSQGWQRATGEFVIGSVAFESIGMYSGGYAAAKKDGKWGVINTGTDWLVPAEYDDIIRDELGRCYAQGAVFAVRDGKAHLLVDGVDTGNVYEDAKPFTDDGWAAVKQDGKWGFIDTSGAFQTGLEPRFEDALSFSGHLAAVKDGELWGYVALTGKIAIEPQFLLAKSFVNGNAPILTDKGYQFISLVEYKKGATL